MSYDFSDAEGQRDIGACMPNGTIVPVIASLRPGNAGEGGWLKESAKGCNMLDFEFTVTGGPFAKRKFWGMFVTDGVTEGHGKAANITRTRLRAMLESARGVSPADDSVKAREARKITSWGDLDGLEFLCKVTIEKSEGYADKNVFRVAVTPDDADYQGFKPGTHHAPQERTKPAAPAAGGKKPAWAS